MKDLKQKVFALYWGQIILYMTPKCSAPTFCISENWVGADKSFVEVTPLSMITDEHKLALYAMGWTYNKKGLQIAPIEEWKAFTPEQLDFLRFNGYATPCFGKEVSELVTMGIFKLKEA